MSIPDISTFRKMTQKGNWVIFSESFSADLETPVSAFLKLCRTLPTAFLFESVERGDRIGRYSLLGTRPREIVRYDGERTYIAKRPFTGKDTVFIGDPVSYMQQTMRRHRIANPFKFNGFQGGYLGYLSYECVADFETLRLEKRSPSGVPHAVFYFIDEYLIFDHVNHTLEAVVLAETGGRDLKRIHADAKQRISRMQRELRRTLRTSNVERNGKSSPGRIRSNLTPKQFKDRVRRIKKYIKAGDCIQTVISQNFFMGKVRNPFRMYRALRSLNPSPYMFFFTYNDLVLVGSSPEVLVKKMGSEVEVRPIAGTRPRGGSNAADLKMEEDLKASKKEHAEHLMLVDLGRNDIGRVCDYKSVEVKEYARVERYSHVMHLVSDIVGTLRSDADTFDLLRATFPAGTVSGAPKIRAMEIINELEPSERGPYAGAVGYVSLTGDMDMCITIRTIVVHKGQASVQAGAGIVYDSEPEAEYHETLNKARALFRAVEYAR